jgi:methyltransferase, FkbM family
LSEFNNNSIYLKFKNLILGSKKNFIDKYTVETNTIDNIFKEIELSNSLLKIDVEGFEINVLKGSSKKLKEISYILVENQFGNHYKNNNTVSVYEFLKDNNFKVIKNFYFPTLHFKDVLYKNEKN